MGFQMEDSPPLLPPSNLSPQSQIIWHRVAKTRIKTASRLALFEQALYAIDRAEEARRQLENEPLVVGTNATGAKRLNPLAKLEVASRALVARIWQQLGLDKRELGELNIFSTVEPSKKEVGTNP